jgi:hypothetical protein
MFSLNRSLSLAAASPRFFSQATCHQAPEVIGGIGEARAAALLKSSLPAARLVCTIRKEEK